MSESVIDKIVEDLISHPDVFEVGLTGGEPMLQKERVLSLITTVANAGKQVTLTTNGFWGVTEKAALETVKSLVQAGLSHLTISWDGYHAPYVKAERIQNVLEAAKQERIPVALNMCVSRVDDGLELLAELGDSTLGIRVTRFPLMPAGAAESVSPDQLYRKPVAELSLRCPGYELIYHHDGRVYPCCSPTIFGTKVSFGGAGSFDHEHFVRQLERNALLAAIQKFGLAWLQERMVAANPYGVAASIDSAVSVCDLCSQLLKDEVTLSLIRPALIEAVRDGG